MNLAAAEERPDPLPTLHILPWPDPVIDKVGHDPRSAYVEQYWLAVLGPASILLLRHLANRFDDEPDGFELDLETCARSLGLGPALGRWGPIQRTVSRCATFGMVRRWGGDRLMARRLLPPLARHHVARLPDHLQRRHQAWLEAALGQPGAAKAPTRRDS